MKLKVITGIMLTLFLIGMLALAFNIQQCVVGAYPPLNSPKWTCIAHIEDIVGDQIAPSIEPDGTAIGGSSYLGADILKAILYSPLGSDELNVTIYLNGEGREDPTIDESRTRVYIEFDSEGLWGYGILYYDGHGWAGCSNTTDWTGYNCSTTLQWISDNVVTATYKGLPHNMSIHWVQVRTERWYLEETDTKYKPYIIQVLDNLVIYDYAMSCGESITQLDLSKQLSPLYNSTMKGMDIKNVDVYRSGEYLNITVTLSDPGITDNSIPTTFRDDLRCQVLVHMKEQSYWAGTEKSVSYGWRESGRQWCIIFNITDLGGWINVDQIEVTTLAQFFSTVDGKIVDGGFSMWWYFDVCSFPVYLLEEYALTIHSSSTGITFTVNNVSHTTPWSGTYTENTSVSLEMPATHNGYVWSHWGEDGDTNRTKTVTMDTNITLTGVFTPVPPVVAATIDIDPDILNLKSKGKWITCFIRLPKGYNATDIDPSTIMLNGTIPASKVKVAWDCDHDRVLGLMVKFNRTHVQQFILNMTHLTRGCMTVKLTVTGSLKDGTQFQGTDKIKVILPPHHHHHHSHHHNDHDIKYIDRPD